VAFFEFILPDQWEVQSSKTLLARNQPGESYRIPDDYSGSFTADIWDVVGSGFYEQALLIVFLILRWAAVLLPQWRRQLNLPAACYCSKSLSSLEDFLCQLSENVISRSLPSEH